MYIKRPPMGYNTWNTFGSNINDALIRETGDAMVEKGLLEAGYEYLVIDDCWSLRNRDPKTDCLVPDPEKFPSGMRNLADYVHSKGLKFGMYSCAGVRTCANYPGSFDHEFLDAQTFAEWGVDFLKYDYCFRPDRIDGPLLYRRMGQALRACGRDILFSACNWGADNVGAWARGAGADMYRSTGDIVDCFKSFHDIAISQADKFGQSGPGCFNDMDMLTVGMFGKGNVGVGGCTAVEYKTQFALWCLFGTPLMLGCDVRTLDGEMLTLLKHPALIAINQDEECRGPVYIGSDNNYNTYARLLSGNRIAIGMFNFHDHERNIFFFTRDLGMTAGCGYHLEGKDVFTGAPISQDRDYVECCLPSHDCAVYLCELVKD